MLSTTARLAAIAALCHASLACSASTPGMSEVPTVRVPVQVPLALSIEELDVRHGTVRIGAPMEDGALDVSMWLGPTCGEAEVGHGIATRTAFAWHLTLDDLSRAIECNLVVKVRAVDEDGTPILKVATVDVGVTFAADANDREAPVLRGQGTTGTSTRLTFRSSSRATRIHLAGAVIGAEPSNDDGPPGSYDADFVVPNDDLARGVISRRPLVLLGTTFASTLRIGNMTYDGVEPPESESE